MWPYLTTTTPNELDSILTAGSVIDRFCGQPLLRRVATMRFDVYDGYGMLPCPLHTIAAVRMNGDQLTPDDYVISQNNFQLRNTRFWQRAPSRDLIEIDGVLGWGTLINRGTGYSHIGALLTATAVEDALPIGTLLYNAGSPVYVQALDSVEMTLSGNAIGDRVQVVSPPPAIKTAARIVLSNIALSQSYGDIALDETSPSIAEAAQYVMPYRARGGGVSTYETIGAVPGFPVEGRAFGPGFGRGFR